MLLEIIKEAYPDQQESFYRRVFALSIFYSLKMIGAFDFQHYLNYVLNKHHTPGPSAKAFRLDLINHSYVCLNCKFFLLSIVSNDLLNNKPKLKLAIKEYKIVKQDFLAILTLLKNNEYRTRIQAHIAELPDSGMTLNQVRDGFARVHTSVFKYIQSITYHKLTFIVNSNNLAYQDIQYELLFKALKSYYLLIPTDEPEAYIVNYLKRAVHNHAMNLIKSYRFQKRDRLTSSKDRNGEYQFTLQCMSENQERLLEDNVSSLELAQEQCNAIESVEMNRTIKAVNSKYKAKSSKIVLHLMLAKEDQQFTSYLRSKNLIKKDQTNVDYYSKASIACYKHHVSVFAGVKMHRLDTFLRNVYDKHFMAKK